MSLKRSERRKASSLQRLSSSKESPSPTTTATSTRKRKVQPVLKDRAEEFHTNATVSDQSTKLSAPTSKKRKLEDFGDKNPTKAPAPAQQDQSSKQSSTKPKPRGKSKANEGSAIKDGVEKRLRRYREKAPQSFLEKLHRAQTQRMVVIGRTRSGTDTFPTEEIDIVGSTGNIYRVTIGQTPSCTCPDHQKGNECKHKVYAMHTVLKAPENLVYQLAYLSSELREIFSGAPPIPTDTASSDDIDRKRKPIEGDCPICFQEMAAGDELVWCKAACGNNAHSECWDQWAAIKRGGGAAVTCVYCRTPWQLDHGGVASLTRTGAVGDDGYVNVAEQFGISRTRDYSVYNRFSRRAMGLGWSRWDGDEDGDDSDEG